MIQTRFFRIFESNVYSYVISEFTEYVKYMKIEMYYRKEFVQQATQRIKMPY